MEIAATKMTAPETVDYEKNTIMDAKKGEEVIANVENDTDGAASESETKEFGQKKPTKNTIESLFADANSKIKMQRTRCEYTYDDATNRISIKIFDKDTDELIKEVPPEESLDMLQKVWELAGIIVDTKL